MTQNRIETFLSENGLLAWKHFRQWTEPGYFDSQRVEMWEEYCIWQGFPRENIECAFKNFEPQDGDVLIVSFAKTGTTWMREIVRQIVYKDDEVAMDLSKDFDMNLIYIEYGKFSKFQVIDELPLPRRYFVTHLPPELINMKKMKEKNVKIIFTLRNPKDVTLSFYNFLTTMPITRYRIDGKEIAKTWNEHFDEVFIEGQHAFHLPQGEWYFDYIKRWMPYFNDENILLVHYEDLCKQPDQELKRIASHIQVEINDEELNRMKEASHISTMLNETDGLDASCRKILGLVRTGGVGKWKEHFTVAQSEFVDKLYQEKLADSNIKFTYS